MSPPTLMSEVPADHQGLGRAIPSFLRTKCARKPVLCLLSSSPGDVALSVSLGGASYLLSSSPGDVALSVSLGGLVSPVEQCRCGPVLLASCSRDLDPRPSSPGAGVTVGQARGRCPPF